MKLTNNNNLKFYTAAAAVLQRGEYSERERERKRRKEMAKGALDGDE